MASAPQKPPAPVRRTANGFLFHAVSDIDGKPTRNFSDAWDWHYEIADPITDPNDLIMAEDISKTAAIIREFYSGARDVQSTAPVGERKACLSIMSPLKNLFAAVVVQGQPVEPEWVKESVGAIRAEFIRRVIEPRHRRNLMVPVSLALAWLAFLLVVALLSLTLVDSINAAAVGQLASVMPAGLNIGLLPGTALMVIAGVLLGRLLFFAVAFGERLKRIEDYIAMQRFTGESASLSLVFDGITGFAAFLLFQSNFLVIAIGASGEVAANNANGTTTTTNTAISTQNIDDNWLIALGFGVLVGLSRAAFLGRVRSLSASQFDQRSS